MVGRSAVLLVMGVGVEYCHFDHGSYPFSPSLPRRGERGGGSTLLLSHLVEITPYGGQRGDVGQMWGWNMQEQGNTSFSQQGNLPTVCSNLTYADRLPLLPYNSPPRI